MKQGIKSLHHLHDWLPDEILVRERSDHSKSAENTWRAVAIAQHPLSTVHRLGHS